MKPLCLVLPEGNQGPENCQEPHQPRKEERSQVLLRVQIGANPLHHFYLSVDGACLLNRYLGLSTGSQVYCSSVVTCGVSGGKSFSLDRCTQLDIPCHLTAVGVAKITLLGPVHFGNSWSWQDPLFPGFKKNLVPGVYL